MTATVTSTVRRLVVLVAVAAFCSPLAGCCSCWCGENPNQPNFFIDTVAQVARPEAPLLPRAPHEPAAVVTARY